MFARMENRSSLDLRVRENLTVTADTKLLPMKILLSEQPAIACFASILTSIPLPDADVRVGNEDDRAHRVFATKEEAEEEEQNGKEIIFCCMLILLLSSCISLFVSHYSSSYFMGSSLTMQQVRGRECM